MLWKPCANPSMARIKLAADFRDFLSLCLSHEVRFMVIGGYAVVHYSRPRYTGDLDLWVDASEENAVRVVAALRDFGLTGPDVTTTMITERNHIIRMGFELAGKVASLRRKARAMGRRWVAGMRASRRVFRRAPAPAA
jgi:hypothetical protein